MDQNLEEIARIFGDAWLIKSEFEGWGVKEKCTSIDCRRPAFLHVTKYLDEVLIGTHTQIRNTRRDILKI